MSQNNTVEGSLSKYSTAELLMEIEARKPPKSRGYDEIDWLHLYDTVISIMQKAHEASGADEVTMLKDRTWEMLVGSIYGPNFIPWWNGLFISAAKRHKQNG
jgi:hypothetical protein